MDSCSSDQSCLTKEDAIEAKAFIDLHKAARGRLADEERFECLAMNGGCAISLPSAPAIGLNRILGLTKREYLDEAYSWMRARTGSRFLQVNTDTASDELKQWIESKGVVAYGPGWAKLSRSMGAVSPPLPGASLLYGRQSLGVTDGLVSTRWLETRPWEQEQCSLQDPLRGSAVERPSRAFETGVRRKP